MPTHTPKFLLPLAILCLPAAAQQAPQETTRQAGTEQGMVVVRDAQTGQLRTPTPAEMRALQPRTPSSTLAPTQPKMVIGPGAGGARCSWASATWCTRS